MLSIIPVMTVSYQLMALLMDKGITYTYGIPGSHKLSHGVVFGKCGKSATRASDGMNFMMMTSYLRADDADTVKIWTASLISIPQQQQQQQSSGCISSRCKDAS